MYKQITKHAYNKIKITVTIKKNHPIMKLKPSDKKVLFKRKCVQYSVNTNVYNVYKTNRFAK